MVRTPSFRVRTLRTPVGAERLLVELDGPDLRRYEAVVRPAVPAVERSLAPGVLANRLGPRGQVPIGPARGRWDRTLAAAASRPGLVVVRSDVRRCYASIAATAVEAGLRRAGVGGEARAGVSSFLDGLRRAGIDGLPVGPTPSAVLANAVLAIGDDAVRAERVAHLRWVDDVAFIGDRRAVHRALAAWRGALAELGMAVHDGKTRSVARDLLRWPVTGVP